MLVGAFATAGFIAVIRLYRELRRSVDESKARLQMMEFASLYTRGIDRLDPVLVKKPFTEDATMDIPNLDRLEPVAAFAVGCTGFLRHSLVCSMHNVSNGHVSFSTDFRSAKSEMYFIANHFKKIDDKVVNATVYGRYCDTWVNKNGTFYICKRKIVYDFQDQSWNKAVKQAQADDNIKSKPVEARLSNMGTRDKSDILYEHLFPELLK